THIGKRLQKAEGMIEGMLMMLDIPLEMDKCVQKEPMNISAHQLCSNF
ncbi:antitermination protein, partial [Xenorhabdus sp. XENO-10]|nr:antitermination protein [Xenorhabdus yunnanensis]